MYGREKIEFGDMWIQSSLKSSIIREATGDDHINFVAPVLISKKPGDSGWRFTIDYRVQNMHVLNCEVAVIDPAHAINRLMSYPVRGVLDLKRAYHTIPLHRNSQAHWAFKWQDKTYIPMTIPMGAKPSAGQFTLAMTEVLGDLLYDSCTPYLDDIIVYGKNPDDYIDNLDKVLDKLEKAGSTVGVKKTTFTTDTVTWVGRRITAEGYSMEPRSLQTILDMEKPVDGGQLQHFVTVAGWTRTQIPDLADIEYPLRQWLEEMKPIAGGNKKQQLAKVHIQESDWTEERLDAFKKVKNALTCGMKLAYPDHTKVMVVFTDASSTCWAGVVCQTSKEDFAKATGNNFGDCGLELLYACSGAFTGSAKSWDTLSKEGFAVIATRRKAAHFLESHPESVYLMTDSKTLTNILTGKPGNACTKERLQRWRSELSTLSFRVFHLEGDKNLWADWLSRKTPVPAATAGAGATARATTPAAVGTGEDRMTYGRAEEVLTAEEKLTLDRVRSEQDKYVLRVPRASGDVSVTDTSDDRVREARHWVLERGTDGLYRKDGRLYIPKGTGDNDNLLRLLFLRKAHHGVGHAGQEPTAKELQRFVFWPGMRDDTRSYVGSCLNCAKTKSFRSDRDFGQAPHGTAPHEVWHMDFVDMVDTSRRGQRYLLVLRDDFSSLVYLVPAESASAETVVDSLRVWAGQWGKPRLLVSDRGSHFTAAVVKDYLSEQGIQQHLSTPNHSQSSGTVEVVHQSVKRTVTALRSHRGWDLDQWDDLIGDVTVALNQRPRRLLGNKSALEICTARPPPTDLATAIGAPATPARTDTPSVTEYQDALADLQEKLAQLHRNVDPVRGAARREPTRSTKKTRGELLTEGQLVLVTGVKRQKHKSRGQATGPYELLVVDHTRKRAKVRHLVHGSTSDNVPFSRLHEYPDPGLVLTPGIKRTILADDGFDYRESDIRKCVGHGYEDADQQLFIECVINLRGRPKSRATVRERLELEQVAGAAPKKLRTYLRQLKRADELDDDDAMVVALIESALA